MLVDELRTGHDDRTRFKAIEFSITRKCDPDVVGLLRFPLMLDPHHGATQPIRTGFSGRSSALKLTPLGNRFEIGGSRQGIGDQRFRCDVLFRHSPRERKLVLVVQQPIEVGSRKA